MERKSVIFLVAEGNGCRICGLLSFKKYQIILAHFSFERCPLPLVTITSSCAQFSNHYLHQTFTTKLISQSRNIDINGNTSAIRFVTRVTHTPVWQPLCHVCKPRLHRVERPLLLSACERCELSIPSRH